MPTWYRNAVFNTPVRKREREREFLFLILPQIWERKEMYTDPDIRRRIATTHVQILFLLQLWSIEEEEEEEEEKAFLHRIYEGLADRQRECRGRGSRSQPHGSRTQEDDTLRTRFLLQQRNQHKGSLVRRLETCSQWRALASLKHLLLRHLA